MAERAEARVSADGRARVEPEFFAAMVSDRAASVDPVDDDDDFDVEDDELDAGCAGRAQSGAQVRNFRSDAATRVEAPAPRPGSRRARPARGADLADRLDEIRDAVAAFP